MTPDQIAMLICEDIKDSNGLKSNLRESILITTKSADVILRLPESSPKDYVTSILRLQNPKSKEFNKELLEKINEQWQKIHPEDEVVYEVSAGPRGTNQFKHIGVAFIRDGTIKLELIPEMKDAHWIVRDIARGIVKMLDPKATNIRPIREDRIPFEKCHKEDDGLYCYATEEDIKNNAGARIIYADKKQLDLLNRENPGILDPVKLASVQPDQNGLYYVPDLYA